MKPFKSRFFIILFLFSSFSLNSWAATATDCPTVLSQCTATVSVQNPAGVCFMNGTSNVGFYRVTAPTVGYSYSSCTPVLPPANYGCVYYADGSKAGTTDNNVNCSGAGGYQIFTGLDAATPYCTDGPAGTTSSAPACPATYTPTATNTQANPPPPPATKAPASAPAPAKPATGAPATAPTTPNAGSNPSNGTSASSSSATTTTNPDGSTTTVTNTTSTTSIDTSSLNQEATQRGINADTSKIADNTAKIASNTDATGVNGTSSGTQATSAVSSSLDSITAAINGNTSANHGLTPSNGFLSQFGSSCGCSPLTLSYHGASVSYDWCPMISKFRDGLSFIFYVIVAWSIFLMLSEMRV
jgi:hypothetical protein